MNATEVGKLTKRVVFQLPPVEPTEGNPDPAWTDYATCWCSIEPISARELLLSMQVQASITHRVKMWWYPGIKSLMRIKWGDRTLGIDSVIDKDEQHIELELICQEVLVV